MIIRLNHLYEKTICDLLLKSTKIYDDLMVKLTKEPKTLEEYIEMKSYIIGEQYCENKKELIEEMALLSNCITTIDNFFIIIPENILEKCYVSASWVIRLDKIKENTDNKLEETKPKIKKIIEDRKNKIVEAYDKLKGQIKSFSQYYNLGQAFDISNTSKEIFSALKALIENGIEINSKEEYLKFNKTNFNQIQTLINDFDKYHNLWDFAEKWKFVKILLKKIFFQRKSLVFFLCKNLLILLNILYII